MNSLDSYLQGPPTGSLSFTSPLEVHCQRCYVLQFLKDAPFSSYSPLHVVALVQIGRSSECQSLPQSCQCPLLLGIKPLFCLGRVILYQRELIFLDADHGSVDGPPQKVGRTTTPLEKDLLFSAKGNIFLLGVVVLPCEFLPQ